MITNAYGASNEHHYFFADDSFSKGLTSEDDLMDKTVTVFLSFPFEMLMGSMIWCWQCVGAITRPTGKSRWRFKNVDECGGDNNCNADTC